jgi:hypothetical protein
MPSRFDLKNLHIYTPAGYASKDFSDLITNLVNQNSLKIDNGNIALRVFSRGEYFDRAGEKFYVHIFAAFGQVYVSVTKVTDDDSLQSIIKSLESEIKRINEELQLVMEESDYWCKRWRELKAECKSTKKTKIIRRPIS